MKCFARCIHQECFVSVAGDDNVQAGGRAFSMVHGNTDQTVQWGLGTTDVAEGLQPLDFSLKLTVVGGLSPGSDAYPSTISRFRVRLCCRVGSWTVDLLFPAFTLATENNGDEDRGNQVCQGAAYRSQRVTLVTTSRRCQGSTGANLRVAQ